jgi:protein-disulfide isomerase
MRLNNHNDRTTDRNNTMKTATHATAMKRFGWILAILSSCFSSPHAFAETPPPDTPPTAISADTADAILQELKEIRKILEKLEKQGQARGPQRSPRPTHATISIKGKQVMGAADAPVTVVEFADYQCPFCLRFTKTTFPHLKRKYIDTGKVRWVALNLPLPFHKDARKAAQAAHCAGEQQRFWEMREILFHNPQRLNVENLPAHAAALSLDMAAFNECLQSTRYLAEIDQDAKDAKSISLTGTPSFIIGRTAPDKITGQVVVGAQPIRTFDVAIDKALAEGDAPARVEQPKAAEKEPAG